VLPVAMAVASVTGIVVINETTPAAVQRLAVAGCGRRCGAWS